MIVSNASLIVFSVVTKVLDGALGLRQNVLNSSSSVGKTLESKIPSVFFILR